MITSGLQSPSSALPPNQKLTIFKWMLGVGRQNWAYKKAEYQLTLYLQSAYLCVLSMYVRLKFTLENTEQNQKVQLTFQLHFT